MPPHRPTGKARARSAAYTPRPASTGHPAYSQTLPREASSARAARLVVSAALHTWGLSRLAEAGTLIVSELVGNAVAHGDGHRVRVTVSRPDPHRVRLAVTDASRTLPTRRTAAEDDEDGRGLAIIAVLAARWGADPLTGGKRVWAELSTR